MFVRNHMLPVTEVVTITPEQTLEKALELMGAHGHDALPVVQDQIVVGLISKQHIYKTYFLGSDTDRHTFLVEHSVKDDMKTDFRIINEGAILEKAVVLMSTMKMQFVVVNNDDGTFAGILTKRNLLEAFANSLGLGKRATRLEIAVDDMEGRLAILARIIAHLKLNIMSLTMIDSLVPNYKKIIMRLDTENKEHVVQVIEDSGFRVINAFLEE